jgi:hypothetical protein
MAYHLGLEPRTTVLETAMLPITPVIDWRVVRESNSKGAINPRRFSRPLPSPVGLTTLEIVLIICVSGNQQTP